MSLPAKNILYAEDDPNDVEIFKIAFRRATLPQTLHVVDDGEAAIHWLSGKGPFADRAQFPLPDILVVDLKMPKKTGLDVLQWARSVPQFKELRVVVLSSSDDPGDVKRAYALGATSYFVKSASFQELMQYLRLSI
jgi:CheY-like chemotaxis protein